MILCVVLAPLLYIGRGELTPSETEVMLGLGNKGKGLPFGMQTVRPCSGQASPATQSCSRQRHLFPRLWQMPCMVALQGGPIVSASQLQGQSSIGRKRCWLPSQDLSARRAVVYIPSEHVETSIVRPHISIGSL